MAEIIEVITSRSEIIVGAGGTTHIEILEVQKQGIQGAPGPGGAAESFTHTQSVAAAEWIVNHNLGAYPLAEIRSAGGVVVEAEILHVSLNQFKVFFDTAYSGFVRCL